MYTRQLLREAKPDKARKIFCEQKYKSPTNGCCDGYLQANVVILEKKYASDFQTFCELNSRPAPLLEVLPAGNPYTKILANNADKGTIHLTQIKRVELVEYQDKHSSNKSIIEPSTNLTLPSSLSDFFDSTQMNGQIKCTISLRSDLQIKVTHNFYTQITMITEVKMEGYHPMNVSVVHVESNKCMFAFNIELNDEIKTEWIKIKVKYNNNFKYSFDIGTVITKIMSKSFEFSKKPQFTTVEMSPKYHNIRQYVFAQTLMDLYNLYFSKDLLSIIFDEYYPNYFDVYGKPFIYDTLDLKNANNVFNIYQNDPIDDYDVTEAFIMTNNKKTTCNINGIGIQLSLNEKYTFCSYLSRKYDIDATNLTAIWPMNASSLSKLQKLRKDLREGYLKRATAAVKAELLLDTNILKTNEFMLWIKWDKKKTYKKRPWSGFKWTNNVSCASLSSFIKQSENDRVLVPIEFKSKETEDCERIAQISSCKKQCKRLYHAKFNKYKKYKHNNKKYRYHRW